MWWSPPQKVKGKKSWNLAEAGPHPQPLISTNETPFIEENKPPLVVHRPKIIGILVGPKPNPQTSQILHWKNHEYPILSHPLGKARNHWIQNWVCNLIVITHPEDPMLIFIGINPSTVQRPTCCPTPSLLRHLASYEHTAFKVPKVPESYRRGRGRPSL